MQNISNNAHNNYNKTFIYPKNKLSEKKKKNFKDYEQNLTIQKVTYTWLLILNPSICL